MYRFESSGGPYDRVLYGCCKGVQGPSSGVEFASVCVRRSGDLGVEMQTLPVKLLGELGRANSGNVISQSRRSILP